MKAGSIPVYEGTLELEFFSVTKNKKINILQQIARNPKTLGYVFRLDKDWRLELRNIAKPQKFHNKKDKEAYEALVDDEIKFNANTFRYEMTSWKPHQNRATFTVYFKQAVEDRDKITSAGFKGANVKDFKNAVKTTPKKSSKDAQAEAAAQAHALAQINSYSLMDGIFTQLQKNHSLFLYSFTVHEARNIAFDDTFFYEIRHSAEGGQLDSQRLETRTQNKQSIGSKSIIKNGSFFLFRSLLVAVIQTFYEEETSLVKEVYKNVLFDKKYFNKLLLLLDQTNMPTEVGTFFSEGPDIRNTFETMVVEFQVFSQFMHDLHHKKDRVTFDFFLTQLFNDLVPRILKASINPKGADKERYRTLYKEQVVFDMSIKDIESSLGDNYATLFRDVNRTYLADKIRSPLRVVYRTGKQYTEKLTTRELSPYGLLKLKNVSALTVVNSVINTTQESQTAKAIIIDRNDSSPSIIIDSETKIKKELFELKNSQILRKGIIPLDWYLKSSPADNLKFRILSNQNETPFKFAVMTDKDADNLRRLAAGEKPFISNIYTVSFTVADVLGIVPYRTRFAFKPEFFGFSSVEEDSFGFSGAYQCDSVSINYNPANLRFEASVNMVYEEQTGTKATGEDAVGDRSPDGSQEQGRERQRQLKKLLDQKFHNDSEIKNAEQQIASIKKAQAKTGRYERVGKRSIPSPLYKKLDKDIAAQRAILKERKTEDADIKRRVQAVQAGKSVEFKWD